MIKKRTVAIILAAILVLMSVFVLSQCMGQTKYFKYTRHTVDGEKMVRIIGLTSQGNQQKILVIPTEINGRRVSNIGRGNNLYGGEGTGHWTSKRLEKVFFQTSKVGVNEKVFNPCSNLNKVIVVEYAMWINEHGGGGVGTVWRYCPYYIPKPTYDIRSIDFYNMMPANTTYYCNYETAINYGCYWVDDVDYGDKIDYIPQDPVREGYSFGGWYKEAECVNKWNFETDTLPEKLLDEDGEAVYQETKLYAKWI